MKTKILTLFSLFALLLVSTAILADGRPTGIRIGRLVAGGGNNVELDITVTGTNTYYPYGEFFTNTAFIGYLIWGDSYAFQVTTSFNAPLPFAVEWGDGYEIGNTVLFGPPGGAWTGTFTHTYLVPGTYTVTVGDAYGPGLGADKGGNVPFTGNPVIGSTRYVAYGDPTFFFNTWTTGTPTLLAITANAQVNTVAGIPTTNTYGLIALALLLVGSGLLLYRKPQRSVA